MDFEICEEAWPAIEEGVKSKSPVAELQLLGLDTRRINQLEDSEYGIVSLDQLMAFTPEQLLEINWLGRQGVKAIYGCLNRYHELPSIRDMYDPGRYGSKYA